ncbi:primase-helicase family protein [Flavobacterium psychroterrae]|nr:primase-helicase family protein [Flavobacterium psychroterrae]
MLNKMYAVGYLLHQYKSASKAYMVLGVDYAGGSSVKGSYGGTGKSFLQKSLFTMLESIAIGGKTLKDDNFPMDGVTPKKKFVLFDDLGPYQPMEYFYNMITDNFIANQKGGVKYNIPFDDSAKVGATTNFAPEMLSSTKRRLLVYYNSDYYHEKTGDNKYPFSRKISDDFNDKNILTKEYSSKEWNTDYNFMLQCIQFYLQQKEKIEAPMDTLINKNAMMQIGDNTVKFLNEFFSDASNLNEWIEKAPVFTYQKDELGNKANSSQRFSENLILYCKAKQWRIELKKKKNANGNSVPHFYISTINEIKPEETEINLSTPNDKVEKATVRPDDLPF